MAMGHALADVAPDELRSWERALTDTRAAWEASYHRQPAERRERALSLLADPTDREPIDDRPRCELEGCDEVVVAAKGGPPKKYCSKRCANRADSLRRRTVIYARARERRRLAQVA